MSFDHLYTKPIKDLRIAILGICPPPFGGVSIHVQRIADQLLIQNNTVYIFDIEQKLRNKLLIAYLCKLMSWLVWHRPSIVYFHGTYSKGCIAELMILCFLKLFIRYSITIVEHDCRHLYKRSRLFKWFYRRILRSIHHVVWIGAQAQVSYQENQIYPLSHSIEGAFLPPVSSMASMVEGSYPSSLFTFLRDFTPLILMNAAHIMTIDGKDIYGFDLAFDMLAGIKNKYPDVGLIIGLARVDDKPYVLLCERMRQLGIAEHIYILQDQKELWPLFKRVDIFIRPTRSDGASISLQEALYFDVPAIASNAVSRPQGVVFFETNDVNDFITVVDQTLQKRVYHGKKFGDFVHP